jgi:hypothetical protein
MKYSTVELRIGQNFVNFQLNGGEAAESLGLTDVNKSLSLFNEEAAAALRTAVAAHSQAILYKCIHCQYMLDALDERKRNNDGKDFGHDGYRMVEIRVTLREHTFLDLSDVDLVTND